MRRDGTRTDDRGDTLVELLVAIAIMGLVFVIVLAGIGTSVVGASTQRTIAAADAALASAAGTVGADSYASCATPATYALGTAPTGITLRVRTVLYWDGISAFGTDCPDPDDGLQQLTLEATDTDHVVTTLTVVKRSAG